ncbi:MAG TPA: amidohydrolase family protein, partial [Ilumatobacter sp.]
MTIVIKGGRVLDSTGERTADVLLDGPVVVAVGEQLDDDAGAGQGVTVLDAAGCIVCPGFVDLHVHLREPGHEEAETVETGARAAALGGYTAIVAMPNTDPAQDSVSVVEFVHRQAVAAGL